MRQRKPHIHPAGTGVQNGSRMSGEGPYRSSFTTTSRLVNELANLPHNRYQPYVGESAFAHKGGIHVSAVKHNPLTYEHIEPEKVGNNRRILISDQAGRSNILHKATEVGHTTDTRRSTIIINHQ